MGIYSVLCITNKEAKGCSNRKKTGTRRFGIRCDTVFNHIYSKGSELNPNMRLFAKLVLKPGCSIGHHVHENEDEIYYILSGTAETDDNGVKRVLHP